jgi:hypothetical protein
MSRFENHAGINITNSVFQITEVAYDNDVYKIINIDESKFSQPINFDTDKDASITAQLQTAYDSVNLKKNITSKVASFTLPVETFLIFQVPFENSLLHTDQLEEFRWELSLLYPNMPAEEVAIQYYEIHKNLLAARNTALVVALPRRFIKLLKNFCENNNLNLAFIDNPHYASERAISLSHFPEPNGFNLSIYISRKSISILFLYEGKPAFNKVFTYQEYSEIAKILTDQLNQAVNKKIDKNLITNAFVCGENVPDELITYLKNTLNLNFKKFNPFNNIKPGPGMLENIYYRQKFNSFAPAAGIAYRLA